MLRPYLGVKVARENKDISVRIHALVCDDAQLTTRYSRTVRQRDVESRY
jgi:hypothetical protein